MENNNQKNAQDAPDVEETVKAPENNQGDSQSTQNEPIESKESNPLEVAKAELTELKDKYVRLYAEFDTFRRRMMKEKSDLVKTAAQDTMTALLPILDDFDRAKKSADAKDSKEQFSEGVNLVYQKLHQVLKQQGLEPMETALQTFDADWHEAVAEIPAPTEELKGKILDTIEKGYLLGGKIIRHAKVVIGK